jgi:hypothetical protein
MIVAGEFYGGENRGHVSLRREGPGVSVVCNEIIFSLVLFLKKVPKIIQGTQTRYELDSS